MITTNFFCTNSSSVNTRFARGMNSTIKFYNNNSILKTASADKTTNEAKMLELARERNVPVPSFSVQIDDCTIMMQFIKHGTTIYDAIFTEGVWNSSIQLEVAEAIIEMWSAGIVHGDLNVNNTIVTGKQIGRAHV